MSDFPPAPKLNFENWQKGFTLQNNTIPKFQNFGRGFFFPGFKCMS